MIIASSFGAIVDCKSRAQTVNPLPPDQPASNERVAAFVALSVQAKHGASKNRSTRTGDSTFANGINDLFGFRRRSLLEDQFRSTLFRRAENAHQINGLQEAY
jgi:hypothetical protein